MVDAGALRFRVEFDNIPEGVSARRGGVGEVVNYDMLEDGGGSRRDSHIRSHNHRVNDRATTEPFGPLKTVLESTSTVYARYEVS